ncbi:MAG TPA: AAA family ATPase [Thermoanaerobaculia bacterium]|nr:AAA family ATPase [Thermoanaerobaculia bacterium]
MADLPSGTVTFLFTDIEGSTALWERDRDAMAAAVARQIALLDAAIQAHGGIHFKTVGDAVQAAFPTAPEAIAAALDAQRSLLAEGWGEIGPLRVRMALHAGEAMVHNEEYQGPLLNRSARLLAIGHGAQVLLSETAAMLARDAMPPGTDLRELGEHRLPDLLEPECIFQLLHPDLPDAFPPLRTLETRPHNLPTQATPFLGREREVAEVVALLRFSDARLVTLTGPGGTGKTRLALQAAAELLDAFPDGIYFVPLAALRDPELVPSAIASALGLRDQAEQTPAQAVREALAGKRLLLVLDNVEQVASAAPFVGELLAAAPALEVLATSRLPLRLRAEHEYPVTPLALPPASGTPPEQLLQYEAVRLFVERAQAVRVGFALTPEIAPAVAEITRRLDGLPLAIELAAARVRLLPPAALLARLEKRLPLLTGGPRDAPARQQTLRDAIAWSYDLLTAGEQALFRRLSIFAGGFSFEAAEAVANPGGELDVLDGVDRLSEHSLLRPGAGTDGEPRFTMLETIREYGLERLAQSGEAEATQRAHTEFFLALVEEAEPKLISPEQLVWLERLEAEHDNLLAALSWAVVSDAQIALRLAWGLAWFWYFRGYLREGRAWLERALAASVDPGPLHAGAFTAAGRLARHLGDYGGAIALLERSLELARSFQDRRAEALALHELGALAGLAEGDAAREVALTEASLALWRELGDSWGTARTLNNLGYEAYLQGDLDRAVSLLDEGVKLARAAGDRLVLGYILDSRGVVAEAQGEFERATDLYREALALAQHVSTPLVEAFALSSLAGMAARQGQPVRAARMWGAASALRDAIGTRLPLEEEERFAQPVAAVRELLGEDAFAAAWEEGRAQPLDQVVAEALTVGNELAMSTPSTKAAG